MKGASHGCETHVWGGNSTQITIGNKMQLRAIMLVDVDLPDFSAAADMEQLLNKTLEDIKKSNSSVSFVALDMKERRGQSKPDLKNMAFRQNKPT